MKRLSRLFLAFVLIGLFSRTSPVCCSPDDKEFRTSLENLESTKSASYRVDSYIRAAQVLQKMGKKEACQFLSACAAEKNSLVPVGDLCRLVFKAKKDSSFRRQAAGSVGFLGGTDYKDWPLDPFEIIDGVPFAITNGSYSLMGYPEQENKYLEYCIRECDWNDLQFVPKSEKEKKIALDKLFTLKKWKRPLTLRERDSLQTQIK